MQDIPIDAKKRGPSSRLLQELIRQAPAEYVTVGWLISHRHSFGIVMLCLGLLATAPVGSMLPGIILAVMALQMIAGRAQPVFPRFLMTRRLPAFGWSPRHSCTEVSRETRSSPLAEDL